MRVLLYGMLRAEGRRGVSAKRKNGGFTLLEMLLTVAVLVILLGLAAVGVARWLHPLKITELDNAAREIYMAAENRVVLLKNSGVAPKRLASADSDPLKVNVALTETGEEVVSLRVLSHSTDSDILNDMLPVGSIDPALREGYFYILYDDSTSHVFEVFYAEKPFSETELNDLRVSRSDRVEYYRADTANHCLVGHYAGGLADKISNKELPKPKVEVIIENGDELTLTVKYEVPTDSLPAGVSVTRKPKVTLKYGEKEIALLEEDGNTPHSDRLITPGSITSNVSSATYTWVLDSLAGTPDPKQIFWNLLGENLGCGGDFTVTASLELTADGYIGSFYSDDDENNSLFAEDSHNTENAYIENLRHLQNLDARFSNAAGKKTAVQRANIDASVVKDNNGTTKNDKYAFKPIENNDLLSYTSYPAGEGGVPYSISNLTVTETSAAERSGAGLFASVKNDFKFQNVRLLDSEITGNSSSNPIDWGHRRTGALVGTIEDATFESCLVQNVKVIGRGDELKDPENNSKIDYVNVGGMAGYCGDEGKMATFNNCQVIDSNVEGASFAGGLLGFGKGTFSNCTVQGNTNVTTKRQSAGGLVGYLDWGEKSTFTNCKATGITVNSEFCAGGIAGQTWAGTVDFKFCEVDGITVTSETNAAGGLLGHEGSADAIAFTDCKVGTQGDPITIKGQNGGGLIGATDGTVTVEQCSVGYFEDEEAKKNHIDITGVNYAGGLVGNSIIGEFTDCNVNGANIKGTGATSEAGGLVGRTEGVKRDPTGHVDKETSQAERGSVFMGCTATDLTVTGKASVGGMVGSAVDAHMGINKSGNQKSPCTVTNVTVTDGAYAGGLAGTAIRGQFVGCEAINARVTGQSEVGGLIGKSQYNFTYWVSETEPEVQDIPDEGVASPIKLDGCQVFWTNDALEKLKNADGTLSYQVTGKTAGGLVGTIRNGATIQNSFAATLVDGNAYAGGLVGYYSVPEQAVAYVNTVTIKKSYADCYIQARKQGVDVSFSSAGGLIGIKDEDLSLALTDVYAAGFIKMNNGDIAGGLYGGWAVNGIAAKNAYAAMHYTGAVTIYPLAAGLAWGQGTNCYWLDYPNNNCVNNEKTDAPWWDESKSYSDMRNISMGGEFTNSTETHSYEGLDTKAEDTPNATYPFPGLNGLPHYGDWLKP